MGRFDKSILQSHYLFASRSAVGGHLVSRWRGDNCGHLLRSPALPSSNMYVSKITTETTCSCFLLYSCEFEIARYKFSISHPFGKKPSRASYLSGFCVPFSSPRTHFSLGLLRQLERTSSKKFPSTFHSNFSPVLHKISPHQAYGEAQTTLATVSFTPARLKSIFPLLLLDPIRSNP